MSKAAVQGGAWLLAAAIGALTSHGPSGLGVTAQQKSRGPAASKPSPQSDRHQPLLLKMTTPARGHDGRALVVRIPR